MQRTTSEERPSILYFGSLASVVVAVVRVVVGGGDNCVGGGGSCGEGRELGWRWRLW